jgi:hypothetical protein
MAAVILFRGIHYLCVCGLCHSVFLDFFRQTKEAGRFAVGLSGPKLFFRRHVVVER